MTVGKLLPTDYQPGAHSEFVRCHLCGDVTALKPDGDRFVCRHPCRYHDLEGAL